MRLDTVLRWGERLTVLALLLCLAAIGSAVMDGRRANAAVEMSVPTTAQDGSVALFVEATLVGVGAYISASARVDDELEAVAHGELVASHYMRLQWRGVEPNYRAMVLRTDGEVLDMLPELPGRFVALVLERERVRREFVERNSLDAD